ncbi:hypothetical protein [Kineosporia sp. NBRC 101731]|uniref:hypothetical protein n=1 Tax=Kineosporia sp. NBRC 101731 TaxID=3032199 RepID=UPI0024A41999|nr:hypothetical protein [Kineosporia sp. NBRC 101731]GLY28220.1 hypothetical protein Kisp02_15850 [Kineosporia sp. NBRC 101731]
MKLVAAVLMAGGLVFGVSSTAMAVGHDTKPVQAVPTATVTAATGARTTQEPTPATTAVRTTQEPTPADKRTAVPTATADARKKPVTGPAPTAASKKPATSPQEPAPKARPARPVPANPDFTG